MTKQHLWWLTEISVKGSPVKVTEFAVMYRINHKSAFNWCIKHVLKKRDRMVVLGDIKRSHIFGVKLSTTQEWQYIMENIQEEQRLP